MASLRATRQLRILRARSGKIRFTECALGGYQTPISLKGERRVPSARRLDVDLLSNAQGIFDFDAKYRTVLSIFV
jgi:hypothetical protein